LIVIGIVVLVAMVLARGRWVSRQPGAFRVTGGEMPGLGTKWRRGYGRWVREILVWTTAPFLFRDELVVADAGGARIGVAVSADGRERASGPFAVGGWMR
jgi:hypothetical protein